METTMNDHSTDQSPAKTTKVKNLSELVQKQKAFFKTGKTRSLKFRKEALKTLLKMLEGNQAEITAALHKDLRKPELEAYSTEIAYVLEDIKFVIKNFEDWAQTQSVATPLVLQPASSELMMEPFGTTLIIAPWNYPFQLVVSPLIGALAAGNTAIVKPSETTAHTQALLMRLITKAFPQEYVACVGGGLKESQELLEEPFDFIFFTGSPRVGKIVMEKAAKHLTPVCLELGGKSPCIVDEKIDLKVAARRIVWGKFMNAGQTCVAPDYLMVHKNVYADFVNQLKTTLTEFYGEKSQESDSYARIVNEDHFDRLVELLRHGGSITGGNNIKEDLYIEPTLIESIDWNHPIMEEEIFGPLLPIFKYENIDDALDKIQSKTKPLAFYIFSKSKSLQNKVLQSTAFGGACVNDCLVHLANPNLPFGGIGTSGMGMYHGKYSFEAFSHKKPVLRKPFMLDANMRYAPYDSFKLKLIKFFMG